MTRHIDRSKRHSTASRRQCRRRGREGAVLFAVIVALTVAAALWLSIIKTAASQRKVIRHQQWAAQATVLADSGLERAAARLAEDADYEGETWNIPAEALGGRHAAAVTIEVQRLDDQSLRRRVRVAAHYPEAIELRASESLETFIETNEERNTP